MKAFTSFQGTLKRLALDEAEEPARAKAFQWAFPGFLDPVVDRPEDEGTITLRHRRRRYSGGLFGGGKSLPRGRYSTVCINANGDDAWGLCQELRAYAGSTLRQKIYVYDLGESDLQDQFQEKGWLVGKRLGLHFVDPDGEMFARYAAIGDAALISAQDPGFWRTHLDYVLEDVEIEGVVDLRLPETQEWFCNTFRQGYGSFWRKTAGGNLVRFQDMISTLMTDDLGGTPVTDAIGFSLRMMGAAALIYPSARCDAETIVEDGTLRLGVGFNLVDFRGAEIDPGEAGNSIPFDDPEPWEIPMRWPDVRCEIAELSEDRELAERWRGSWRVSGIRQGHEQFWESGGVLGGRAAAEWDEPETSISGEFARRLMESLRKTQTAD